MDGLGELTQCDVRADLADGPDPARVRVVVTAGGAPLTPGQLAAVRALADQFVREAGSVTRCPDLG